MQTLALNTLSDATAYAFVQSYAGDQSFNLYQLDLNSQTASYQSATLPSNSWSLTSLTVEFIDQATSDIFLSALFNIDSTNYKSQALVLSSMDSRRNTAFFASSWTSIGGGDGTFMNAGSYVTSLDASSIQNNFAAETAIVSSA